MKPRLIFSRDPGGARQMLGVYRALTDGGADMDRTPGIVVLRRRLGGPDAAPWHVFAKDYAGPVWQAAGLSATPWSEDVRLDSFAAILTATSDVDDDTPQRLWRAARAAGVPTHAFVDGNFNLASRFRDRDGAPVLPDYVYAPGQACAAGLAGVMPPERVTAIPDLIVWLARRDLDRARDGARVLRRRWLGGAGRRVILFVSENVEELATLGKPCAYSEYESLDRLLAALRGEAAVPALGSGRDTTVIIRLHPKERAGKFARYEGGAAPTVIESREGTSAEAVLAADLVVGMRSTLLREAAAAGRPVFSLIGHDIATQAD